MDKSSNNFSRECRQPAVRMVQEQYRGEYLLIGFEN
jgi:hypothetical protein